MTTKEMADIYGITRGSAGKIVRAAGVKPERTEKTRMGYSENLYRPEKLHNAMAMHYEEQKLALRMKLQELDGKILECRKRACEAGRS